MGTVIPIKEPPSLMSVLEICRKVIGKELEHTPAADLQLAVSLLLADRLNEVQNQLTFLNEKMERLTDLEEIRSELHDLVAMTANLQSRGNGD